MWLKNKLLYALCLTALCAPAQAGLFGISPKDRHEFTQARETYNRGDYRQAVAELTNYIYKTKNIKRREARAYRLLGMSYEQLGRPAQALETYQEALEFHEKDVPLLLASALLYQRTGLMDRSVELYDRALHLEPNNLEALAGQAENYVSMNFYSRARQYYEQLFRLDPRAPAVHRARYAYAFLKQRDYANAFINITMAKMENNQNPNYWLLSARAYKGLGLLDDAMADLDAAALLAPDRTDIPAIKALWLYQNGEYAASLAAARDILKRDPQNELALFASYLNLQKQGHPILARRELQKLKNLNTDSFAYKAAVRLLEKK